MRMIVIVCGLLAGLTAVDYQHYALSTRLIIGGCLIVAAMALVQESD